MTSILSRPQCVKDNKLITSLPLPGTSLLAGRDELNQHRVEDIDK